MSETSLFLTNLIGSAVGSQILLALAIVVCTFILEDTTVVVVGLLAADGIIPLPLALGSLYTGIILGDIVMYSLGYLASMYPRLGRYVDHDFVAPFRAWLENRFILTVFSARFIPGSRMPTYAASGFFRSSFSTFIATVIAATSIWTTFLFTVSYLFGSLTTKWMKEVRWGIAFAVLVALFLIARHNLRAYLAKKNELGTGADTRTPSEL